LQLPPPRDRILTPADVEHAAVDQGKHLHAAVAPVLQYEGFEHSPSEKDDPQADGDAQLVRRDIQTCEKCMTLILGTNRVISTSTTNLRARKGSIPVRIPCSSSVIRRQFRHARYGVNQ
jgi:hypothetical protein